MIRVCYLAFQTINTSASQGPPPKRPAPSPEPRARKVENCDPAAECNRPAAHLDCRQEKYKTAQDLHPVVSSQMAHTEEALQDAMDEKVYKPACKYYTDNSSCACISLSRRCYNRRMIRSSYWQIASNSLLMYLQS